MMVWACCRATLTALATYKLLVCWVCTRLLTIQAKILACCSGSTVTELCWTVGGCGRKEPSSTYSCTSATRPAPINRRSRFTLHVTFAARAFQHLPAIKAGWLWAAPIPTSKQRSVLAKKTTTTIDEWHLEKMFTFIVEWLSELSQPLAQVRRLHDAPGQSFSVLGRSYEGEESSQFGTGKPDCRCRIEQESPVFILDSLVSKLSARRTFGSSFRVVLWASRVSGHGLHLPLS